jgi:hypothetical protein
MTLQQAIARQEGFGQPKTLATVNHNPGNIIAGAFAFLEGAVGSVYGYAIFLSDQAGWAALTALLSGPDYIGLTVFEAINRYCPPPVDGNPLTQGNNPDAYLINVCAWLGCSPDTPIAGLLGTANEQPKAQ